MKTLLNKSRIIIAISFIFFCIGFVFMSSYANQAFALGTNYYVDPLGTDNGEQGLVGGNKAFATIQYAINDSRVVAGDTINVAAGTYNLTGQILVDKTINLIGNISNPSSLILNAKTEGDTVFQIGASNASISGFTIHGNANTKSAAYGFENGGFNHVTIQYCVIQDFLNGIYFYNGSDYGTISHNSVTSTFQGFVIDASSYMIIESNTANQNDFGGFNIEDTSYVAASTPVYPVVSNSNNNSITNNVANHNGWGGFIIFGSSLNTFSNNIANQNGSSSDGAGFSLEFSNDNIFNNNTVNLNGVYGFYFSNGANDFNTFNGNTITGNRIGISIESVDTNSNTWIVSRNNISGNTVNTSNYGTGTLDASRNWWSSTVPTNIELGIEGSVNYTPYYMDFGMTYLSDSLKYITSFSISDQVGPTLINNTDNTIKITMPNGTNVTSLVPTIYISTGATIQPASDVINNFTTPQQYIVTALDSSTREYTVTVFVEPDLSAYNSTLAAVTQADYTTGSWTSYQGVVTTHVVTVVNTQPEVDAATLAINTAQGSLVFAGQADLDTAEGVVGGLTSSNYTIISWGSVSTAMGMSESTNVEVVAKTTAINNAVLALVLKASLTAYNLALAAVTETNYTSGSWATYQGVVNANVVTVENLQSVVDTATGNITAAQTHLITVLDGAKTTAHGDLTTALGTYHSGDYTGTNWTTLNGFKTTGDTNIESASDLDGVALAKTTALTGMENVPTIAETLALAKTTAHGDLTTALGTYHSGDYTGTNWTTLNGFKTTGDTNIESASDLDGVTSAKNTAINGMAGVDTIAETLSAAKTTAHGDLTTALGTYHEGVYTSSNWTTLTGFKTTGDTNIDLASDLDGVALAKTTALTGMENVPTIAETLAAEKTSAHESLTTIYSTYVIVESNYSGTNWIALTGYKTAGDGAIDDATNITEVSTAYDNALELMAGVLTIDQTNHAAANLVIAQISALRLVDIIDLSDKSDIVAARASYDALTPDQQALVTNISTLTDDEEVITNLEAIKSIDSFDFNSLDPVVVGVINDSLNTITLTVTYDTDITNLVPTITYSGESVEPASLSSYDFTDNVLYTVTAIDQSTRVYTVTVDKTIQGDINGDNVVDRYDFSMMMADWGVIGTSSSDLNHDGVVDRYDFSLLMLNWSY